MAVETPDAVERVVLQFDDVIRILSTYTFDWDDDDDET